MEERGFLLPLHRHRETNYPGFLLSDDGTRAISGNAVFKGSSRRETVLAPENCCFLEGGGRAEKERSVGFPPCILLSCRLDSVLVVLLT